MGLVVKSFVLFVLAGLCEIGGGYLVWQWWRNGAPWLLGLLGAAILVLYGIVPTYQPAHFGRVYAAYGGVYISVAIVWLWVIDAVRPTPWDWLGVALSLAGMAIIMFAPRHA